MKKHNITNYEFVNAVNGYKLTLTPKLRNLFNGNDFGNRKGVIGCALSHLSLWEKLLSDTTTNHYVILEDDILSTSNFNLNCPEYEKYEVLFLGYSMFSEMRKTVDYNGIYPLNKNLYIGGFFLLYYK